MTPEYSTQYYVGEAMENNRKMQKNRFFQNSSTFQEMVPIGFGRAYGCCFDLKTVL